MSAADSSAGEPTWWVIRNGRRYGPFTWRRLRTLGQAGKINSLDEIYQDGAAGALAEHLKRELFSEPEPPPLPPASPPPADEAESSTTRAVTWPREEDTFERTGAENGQRDTLSRQVRRGSSLARLFVTRILQSDFGVIEPTEEERQRLLQAPVPLEEPLAQAYAAWRRSVLSIASGCLAFNALLGIGNLSTSFDGSFRAWNFVVIGFVTVTLFLLQVLGAVLTAWAAAQWHNIGLSRRLARASWVVVFLLPIAVFAVPLAKLATLSGGWTSNLIVMKLVVERAMVLFPRVLGLFPGVIRACMTLKTLVPESSAPGWTALIVTPAYSLFFFVSVAVALQITLSPALIGGLLLLGSAPLIYLCSARELMRSHDEDQGRRLVKKLRRTSGLCTAVGLVLILIQLMRWVDLGDISWRMLISSVAGLLGSLLLFTVVGSDLILALLRQSFEESRSFAGSERQRQLERKFVSLTRVGLTDITAGEDDLVRQVRDTVGQAARHGKRWAPKREARSEEVDE